jgi:hypothetical protein
VIVTPIVPVVVVVVVADVQAEVEETGTELAVVVPIVGRVQREPRSRQPASRDEDGPEGAQRAADESSEPAHGHRG